MGKNHTIREFVEKAFSFVGIKGYWNYVPNKPESEYFSHIDHPDRILVKINPKFYRTAEVDVLCANSDKIRTELGWQPKITFDGMIEKMVTKDLTLVKNVV